ncbi:MAG TPA: tetratricopeptide repeat protein [bacterium]|jgi:tetratricopeptide (TPR) repeat protein
MTYLCVLLPMIFAWAAFGDPLPAPEPADSLQSSDLFFERGYSEYLPGHLEAALSLFDSSLTYNPHNARAWHSYGATLARLNRHAEAQRAFDRALGLKPDYVSAWWHRGCDNSVAGRADTALADLAHAIALDSTVKSWPFSDPCWNPLLDDPRLLILTAPYTKDNVPKE